MRLRLCVALGLSLLTSMACKGDVGPMGPAGPAGPQGPAGPGTRVVFTGVTSSSGGGSALLPPAAGTLANPPGLSCYIGQQGGTALLLVGVETGAGVVCGLVQSTSGLNAVLNGAPAAWRYMFVVVY